jgi:tyrosine-protein kinase Etk/Wzc
MSSDTNRADPDEIDLPRLLASVWGNRFWIAVFAALFLLAAVFYIANRPRIYEADALLQLEEQSGGMGLPSGLSDFMESDPRSVTEIEIIRSLLVLAQVVGDLNLDWVAVPVLAPYIGNAMTRYDLPIPNLGFLRQYGREGDSITVDLLEVPPEWVDKGIKLTSAGDGSFSAQLPDGSEMEGRVGQILRDASRGFSLKVGALNGREGRVFNVMHINERRATESLRSRLSITESGRQSGILEARFTDPDPQQAARTLNAITKAYVGQNINRGAAEAESSLSFIEQQLPGAKATVEVAEKALNDYRQSQKSVDLAFETENVLSQITRIETELRELQLKEDDLKQRYKPSHPSYQQLLAQRVRLQDSLAEAQKQVESLPETQREVVNLSSNLELARQIYTELQTRAQEVRVLRASSIGNVRIIDEAQPRPGSLATGRNLILLAALLAGMATGVGFGLAKMWLRRTIQGTEALEALGLPVFATINLAKAEKGVLQKHGEAGILAIANPADLAVEGLRSLRTSLQFGMLDAKSRSLAITSTAPGAGKSFTAANLAVVIAQAGQSVCLIDTDLRRGQLRKMFGVAKNQIGLSEYLTGERSLDEVIVQTGVEGLCFIPTGRYPPNPSELLLRKNMAELVAELDARFEMSIFDCPPVLAVTDPVIVGGVTGGLLAVVRYDKTPPAEVTAMTKILDSSGLKITGAILNGFDPRQAQAGGYSYNYNYRYEYKSRTKDAD